MVITTINLSSLNGTNGFRLDGVAPDDFNSMRDASSSYMIFGKGLGFDASLDLSSLDSNDGFRLNGDGGALFFWQLS